MATHGFTDKVRITVKAGDGGDGMNSFKAFKGKPACGPDGGDGGDGGSVYLLADENVHDLLAYRFTAKYEAGNGERGGSNQCFGKRGADVVLKVPCGTLVRDAESGKIICDVYENGEKILLLQGGKGGKGNVRFTTARRHAPNFAQKGVRVKPHAVILEMKVIADVGLVGFPNVGKSTLLSKISAARPKIADYHFTTLSPNLGVVQYYEHSFVVADIPGLIEGAAQGAGLGHGFLRHIERTRMICHVLDIAGVEGRDPLDDYDKINAELAAYSQKLAALPQIVVLNKCDCAGAKENAARFASAYPDVAVCEVCAVREKYGIPQDRKVVLAVGAFSDPRKGLKAHFLECARRTRRRAGRWAGSICFWCWRILLCCRAGSSTRRSHGRNGPVCRSRSAKSLRWSGPKSGRIRRSGATTASG